MGRFDSLKGDKEKNKESNPFKKGGRRKEKNEKVRDFSKMKGTMPLPGLNNNSEKKSGKYVAPGLRNKTRSRNSTPNNKPVFKTEDKFREKEGDFPELGATNDFPDLNKTNEKTETQKATSKWSNIVSEKEKSEPLETPKEDTLGPVPPGCVRLRLDKKTRRTIIEHGPTTKEHRDFMARMEYIKVKQAEKEYKDRMREYEEYNRIMYPNDDYINSWEWDDHVHHQEWLRKLAEDDGHFDISDNDSEYYSDEYN
tara:strand:- start:2759 stop:3520 length:762 start_codon:yes stop_codon:yes gene_type:complete